MKQSTINVLMFAVGAAIGSAVTWKLVKTKYELLAQEEIDSVKEAFSSEKKESTDKNQENVIDADEEDIAKLHDIVNKMDYASYSSGKEKKGDNDEMKKDTPYVISPDEFGEIDDYETVSLTYYEDGVLTDESDEPIEDIENTVGYDAFNHFGEYEDDSVFVRNDELMTDYEILMDMRKYSDVEGQL